MMQSSRIADQIHFGSAALDGRFGIFLPQLLLQAVEGQVSQDR